MTCNVLMGTLNPTHSLLYTFSFFCFISHFPGGPRLASTRISPFWILLELRVMEVVVPTSHLWSSDRQHLRSSRYQQLNVPRVRRVIGRHAFASAGPTVWNSLPDNLCDSTVGRDQFQRELKTHLFACLLNISSTVHQRFFYVAALYKFIFTFTYLLTYSDVPTKAETTFTSAHEQFWPDQTPFLTPPVTHRFAWYKSIALTFEPWLLLFL